jgi:hypothetical protein
MNKDNIYIKDEDQKGDNRPIKDPSLRDIDKENNVSLKEVIVQQATEEEQPLSAKFTLRKILGGDLLPTRAIRRQIWLIMLIVFIVIIYISNRYCVQKDLIEIDNLQTELQNAKYRALSTSSQYTEKSRESHILEMLKNNKDSVLKIASQPPYIINIPDGDE